MSTEKINISKAAIMSVIAVRVFGEAILDKVPHTATTSIVSALLCVLYFITRVPPVPVLPGLIFLSNVPQEVDTEMHWTSSTRPQPDEFYAAAKKSMKRNATAMADSEYVMVDKDTIPLGSVGWTAGVSVTIRNTGVRCGFLSGLFALLVTEVLVGERRLFIITTLTAVLVISEALSRVHRSACLVVSKDRNHMEGSTQKVTLMHRGANTYGKYDNTGVDSKGRLRVATGDHLVTTLALSMSADDLVACVRGTVERDSARQAQYTQQYKVIQRNLLAFDEKYGTKSWNAFLSNVLHKEDAPELFAYAVLPRGNLIFFSAKQAARKNRSDPESPNLHVVCTPGGGVDARERWFSKYMVDIEAILPSAGTEGAACRECREEAALSFSDFVKHQNVRMQCHPYPGGGVAQVPINTRHNVWANIVVNKQ